MLDRVVVQDRGLTCAGQNRWKTIFSAGCVNPSFEYMYIYTSTYKHEIIYTCMFVHAFMLMDRLQVLAESFMWHRYLESILFGLSSWSHRPAPGIAEWVLFGLICFSLGVCCGCIVTSLCCSSRLQIVGGSAGGRLHGHRQTHP